MTAKAKTIPDHVLSRLTYNAETGEIVWNCGSKNAGRVAGSIAKDGYRHIGFTDGGKFRSVLAHRVAWMLHFREQPPEQIDHINRQRSDNRIANLRPATPAENARHRGPIRNAKYKGVAFDPSSRTKKPWRAYIHLRKRRIYIGRYETAELALEAYKVAARKFHGEFASWE